MAGGSSRPSVSPMHDRRVPCPLHLGPACTSSTPSAPQHQGRSGLCTCAAPPDPVQLQETPGPPYRGQGCSELPPQSPPQFPEHPVSPSRRRAASAPRRPHPARRPQSWGASHTLNRGPEGVSVRRLQSRVAAGRGAGQAGHVLRGRGCRLLRSCGDRTTGTQDALSGGGGPLGIVQSPHHGWLRTHPHRSVTSTTTGIHSATFQGSQKLFKISNTSLSDRSASLPPQPGGTALMPRVQVGKLRLSERRACRAQRAAVTPDVCAPRTRAQDGLPSPWNVGSPRPAALGGRPRAPF